MLDRKKDLIKIDDFQAFFTFNGILVRFSIKIGDFSFDFSI